MALCVSARRMRSVCMHVLHTTHEKRMFSFCTYKLRRARLQNAELRMQLQTALREVKFCINHALCRKAAVLGDELALYVKAMTREAPSRISAGIKTFLHAPECAD